jgi:hypothetical protein
MRLKMRARGFCERGILERGDLYSVRDVPHGAVAKVLHTSNSYLCQAQLKQTAIGSLVLPTAFVLKYRIIRQPSGGMAAGYKPEVHIFASGGHGFGMRTMGKTSTG